MSGINQIRIYYGQGEVVNGPSRADLGPFPHITVDHPHPESASIRDLKDWFMAMFQLDANQCSVTVHCLYITGINLVVYELRVADRTYKWRKWVEWCRRCNVPLTILVQPCAMYPWRNKHPHQKHYTTLDHVVLRRSLHSME